jgi:hypothetical protein
MTKLICFGDSWAVGAELQKNQEPFVHWTAQKLNIPYMNYGKEGSSLGLILHTIVSKLDAIAQDDIVIVIVPPDTRWYDENHERGFYSVQNWQRDEYLKFVNNKTLEWFIYHHALFVYTIQKLLDNIGCQYILAHNYGQISEYKKYKLPIDFSKFLNQYSLTDILSGYIVEWKGYPDFSPDTMEYGLRYHLDGPPDSLFSGVYFENCKSHPNELGHKKIAELILKKIDEQNVSSNRG